MHKEVDKSGKASMRTLNRLWKEKDLFKTKEKTQHICTFVSMHQ